MRYFSDPNGQIGSMALVVATMAIVVLALYGAWHIVVHRVDPHHDGECRVLAVPPAEPS